MAYINNKIQHVRKELWLQVYNVQEYYVAYINYKIQQL